MIEKKSNPGTPDWAYVGYLLVNGGQGGEIGLDSEEEKEGFLLPEEYPELKIVFKNGGSAILNEPLLAKRTPAKKVWRILENVVERTKRFPELEITEFQFPYNVDIDDVSKDTLACIHCHVKPGKRSQLDHLNLFWQRLQKELKKAGFEIIEGQDIFNYLASVQV